MNAGDAAERARARWIEAGAPPAGDLWTRVRDELGRVVIDWSVVLGGTNNRLFRLETDTGRPLLAKFYHRDRWNRLEREFGVLSALRKRGVRAVPRPLLRDDAHGYAVYSFEPGRVLAPASLDAARLRAVAAFAADLHRIRPDDVASDVPLAIGASFSVEEHVGAIDARLRAFEEFAAGPTAYDEVRTLHRRLDLRGSVDAAMRRAVAGLEREALARSLPRDAWRLSTGDFGVHNLLFAGADALTVVDFEWSGWDDPARLVMGFVAHGGSEGLSAVAAEAFLGTYASLRRLSDAEIARFERVGALLEVEWIAAYASALTAENVAAKEFATAGLDRHAYLTSAIAKLEARVERVAAGAGYRFPSSLL